MTGLLEQYLEPLRNENFLSAAEMLAIFGNIREMITVQRRFLKSLESALESDVSTPLESITHPSEFKVSFCFYCKAALKRTTTKRKQISTIYQKDKNRRERIAFLNILST